MSKPIYQYFARDIATNETQEFNVYGRYFTVLDWAGTLDAMISIDGQPEQQFPKSLSIELPKSSVEGTELFFGKIRIRNTNAGTVNVKIATSAGKISDNRVVISGALDSNVSTNAIETPQKITVTAVAGAISIPADTTQREIIIENHSANVVWLGDSNVDGSLSRGITLSPSEKMVLTSEAQIFFHAPAGNSDLSYMRMTK